MPALTAGQRRLQSAVEAFLRDGAHQIGQVRLDELFFTYDDWAVQAQQPTMHIQTFATCLQRADLPPGFQLTEHGLFVGEPEPEPAEEEPPVVPQIAFVISAEEMSRLLGIPLAELHLRVHEALR